MKAETRWRLLRAFELFRMVFVMVKQTPPLDIVNTYELARNAL